MSRMNQFSLIVAGIVLAIWQSSVIAEETANTTAIIPVAQMTPTPIVIPMQQAYCHQRPCYAGCYAWNGPWGPGYYWALPRLHPHRSRYIRPD